MERIRTIRPSLAELAIGLRSLANLLGSTMPLTRVLDTFETMAPSTWRAAIAEIRSGVRNGKLFSSAINDSPLVVPPEAHLDRWSGSTGGGSWLSDDGSICASPLRVGGNPICFGLPILSAQRVAALLYPAKALRTELHHVVPKYLGGLARGTMVRVNAAYHQLITNEFRRQWPYGSGIPSAQVLRDILRRVYNKYPLP